MKIGEWYSAASPKTHYYCIRITEIVTDTNTSGEEEKFLKCFFITANKACGEAPKLMQPSILKFYNRIKDKAQIAKLEKFYKENSKATAETDLNDFLKDL
jgi:hypothetical protein